ncbi:MAG: 4Fe-4S dicluster domain-containing protein [Chloroflexota bacterium]|nr:4Fe-4S dicluster domain-containing protein [Chloroflexota bacterium]
MRTQLSTDIIHSDFVKKVEEISGQTLLSCYQCGKCSAGCPMCFAMDLLPNQIIRLAQLGQDQDIAKANTIWICASCITCSVRCPRGVDLARVMEALRLITMRKNVDHVQIPDIPKETIGELPQLAMVGGFRKLTA